MGGRFMGGTTKLVKVNVKLDDQSSAFTTHNHLVTSLEIM
jgi:hypothetical protein